MIITSIEEQKKHKDRVNLYVDGEFFKGMSLFNCMKFHLAQGMEIDEDRLKFLTDELEKENAIEKAMKHLSKQQKTRDEMTKFLLSKGFEESVVIYAIAKLEEYSYIDDEKYVRDYIRSYMNKEGKRKIEYSLKLKGIDDSLIAMALSETEFDDDVILRLAKKYVASKTLDLKTKQNLYRHLSFRGFDSDKIMSVINKIFNE